MKALIPHLEVMCAAQGVKKEPWRRKKKKAFGIKKDYQDNKRANIRAVMTAASIQLRIRGGGSCALYVGHGETRGLPEPDDVTYLFFFFFFPPSPVNCENIFLPIAPNLKRRTLPIDDVRAERDAGRTR